MAPVLSPAEIGPLTEGKTFSVGGRIVYAASQVVVLADALGQVSIELAPNVAPSLNPGDLAVALLHQDGGMLTLRELKRIGSHPEPHAGSEFGRRALSERGRALLARARAKSAVRRYFEEQAFVEVDTPALASCPGLDSHVHSWSEVKGQRGDVFLVTSPEFHMKRLLSSGLPRIYQLGHCFRAEEDGPWHQPEFMMLEWYRAFADWESTIHDTEEVVRRAADAIADEETKEGLEAPFERITVRDAFSTFGGVSDAIDLAHTNESLYFEVLVDRVEPALARFPRPIFLTHYPLSQAALARPSLTHNDTAERYELYFRGQELCNGFSELTDPRMQRERFEAELARRRLHHEPEYPIDEALLAALAEGMPPSSGTAVGFDRLIATLLGFDELKAVLAFSEEER